MINAALPPPATIERVAAGPGAAPITVLRCAGEFDNAVAGQLTAAIADALAVPAAAPSGAGHPPPGAVLVVDLRAVDFLSASTVTALLEGRRLAPAAAPPVRLVIGENTVVRRVVDLTGIRDEFAVHHDVDDAVRDRLR